MILIVPYSMNINFYFYKPMKTQNTSQKVSKTQLMHILEVSYNTARKEYQIILDSLELTRDYLTISDLIKYGILS